MIKECSNCAWEGIFTCQHRDGYVACGSQTFWEPNEKLTARLTATEAEDRVRAKVKDYSNRDEVDLYDQTNKFDGNKLRYDLVPPAAIKEIARALTYGAEKYSANSWQEVEPFSERYVAALYRHLEDWRDGEDIDQESGLHHLTHAITNLAFLVWKEVKYEG